MDWRITSSLAACALLLSACLGVSDNAGEAVEKGGAEHRNYQGLRTQGFSSSVKIVLNGQEQEPISAPVTCDRQESAVAADLSGGGDGVIIVRQFIDSETPFGWKGWQINVTDADPPSIKALTAAGYPGMKPSGSNFFIGKDPDPGQWYTLTKMGNTYIAAGGDDYERLEITATCT